MVPPLIRRTRTPPVLTEDKVKRKERILSAVSKLNDRDTQSTAAQELKESIKVLDLDDITTLLVALLNTPAELGHARKEAVRLLNILASRQCPFQSYVTQAPQVHKIVGFYKACLKDKEVRIRDLAGEAMGLLAQHVCESNPSMFGDEIAINPILKALFELLTDQKREVQSAACTALSQVLLWMTTIPPRNAKHMVRLLNSQAFLAKGALIVAIGHRNPQTGKPAGLIMQSKAAWVHLLPDILGLPGRGSVTEASGLVVAMHSSDWQTRRAAVECVRALYIAVGPAMETHVSLPLTEDDGSGTTGLLEAAVGKMKYDKVKAVRDSALDTLITLSQFQAFRKSGQPPESWEDWLTSPEAFRNLCTSAEPSTEGAVMEADEGAPTALRPPSSARLSRPGSALRALRERQRRMMAAQAQAEDGSSLGVMIYDTKLLPTAGLTSDGGAEFGPVRTSFAFLPDRPEGDTAPPLDRYAMATSNADPSADGVHPAAADSIASSSTLAAPPGQAERTSRRTWQVSGDHAQLAPMSNAALVQQADLASQVADLKEQNAYLLSLMDRLTTSVTTSLHSLETRMADLETSFSRQQQGTPVMAPGLPPHTLTTATGDIWASPVTTLTDISPGILPENLGIDGPVSAKSVSLSPWITTGGSDPQKMLDFSGAGAGGTAMEHERPSQPEATLHTPPLESEMDMSSASGYDTNAAYADALHGSQGDLALLRLMQKTGPVWKELKADVADSLLKSILQLLVKGTQLPRILPWLWALADEEASTTVAREMQVEVVAALAQLPTADEGQTSQNVSLLLATLKAAWGIDDWSGAPSPTPLQNRRASKAEWDVPLQPSLVRGTRHSIASVRHEGRNGSPAEGSFQLGSAPRASLDSLAGMQAELLKLEKSFNQMSPGK